MTIEDDIAEHHQVININYGNELRREIFERIFWDDLDRNHSAFQSFVDCCTPVGADEQIMRDWCAFRDGWNAGWIDATRAVPR